MDGRIIEISKKNNLAGRVYSKWILHRIFDDDTEYNSNGISWQNPYVEQNMNSVKGMPLVTCFLNNDKTIPYGGHGELNLVDGNVYFEDSLVVGTFENAYIEENIEVNGEKINALIGEAYIYEQRFPHLVEHLREQVNNNIPIESSVEVCAKKSEGNSQIVYATGYKIKGRIPQSYDYSGHAILFNDPPADSAALMIELNRDNVINNLKKVGDNIKSKNIIQKGRKVEFNELNVDDIASIIIRAFNKLMQPEDWSKSWDYDDYFIHRLYQSKAVMRKWNEPGVYYAVTYNINNSEVNLGDAVRVEEDWKPVETENIELNIDLSALEKKFKKDKSIEFNKSKGGNKMEDLIREKDKKIEELNNQIAELNTKLSDSEKNFSEVNTKVGDLEKQIEELNTTIVEVNKTLEAEKTEKETMVTELNNLREFKSKEDERIKKEEINNYFENEIKKNGFTEAELNSLKAEYVEKMDLEGLKKAESELCVKKIKELNSLKNNVETNSKTDNDLFMAIHNNENSEEDFSDILQ